MTPFFLGKARQECDLCVVAKYKRLFFKARSCFAESLSDARNKLVIERNKSRQELDKLLVLTTNHVLQNKQKCCVLHSLILAYIRIFRSVFTAFGDEVLFCTRQFSSKSRVNCVKISCSTIHLLARALLVISGCGVQSLKTIHRDSVKNGSNKMCNIDLRFVAENKFYICFFF